MPVRVVGSRAAPGCTASPERAAAHARDFFGRHLEVLAPGSSVADWRLVANDLDRGIRTVGFVQRVDGMDVVGAKLGLRYLDDRLVVVSSEALPDVRAARPTSSPSPEVIADAARFWVEGQGAAATTVVAVDSPWVLPLIGSAGVRHRVAMRAVVDARDPLGRYEVYLDAADGEVVAWRQLLRFATGDLLYDVPERWPGGGRAAYPATLAHVELDASPAVSDLDGAVSWPGSGVASLLLTASGEEVTVNNVAGPGATMQTTLADGGVALWDGSGDELTDAQLSAYIHAGRALAYARVLGPSLPLFDQPLVVNVNLDLECNAFYDGSSINFFRSSQDCGNTARLADIVFHEFGHALHGSAVIAGVGEVEKGLGEGLSDYFAATMTGDPAVGVGWHKTSGALRNIDPSIELVWPDDIGGPHTSGRIISGALWDLRKLLVAEHGPASGVALTDHLFYQAMRRSVDIPTTYFEVLVADDDDGDLDNGTPNVCAIDAAFGAHGLRQLVADIGAATVAPPGLDGYTVTLALAGLHAQCPADAGVSALLVWRRRDQPLVGGEVPFSSQGDEPSAAAVPAQPDGTVVQYRVQILLGDGTQVPLPSNPADPWYEMFIGHVEPIYCTDFETDPFAEGWTHGGDDGAPSSDDWQWGIPVSLVGSGDPSVAHSGERVLGNDLGSLGEDGKYAKGIAIHADSPPLDVSGYAAVRLQYRRWLEVEDGFYDQARVEAGGQMLWQNLDSQADGASTRHHRDHEWRFHDVDLTAAVDDQGQVSVRFRLDSDQGLELGGWAIDDLCVVGWVPTVCGDGQLTGIEICDEGEANSDTEADACRSDCTPAGCGDGVRDGGEECDDGNELEGDGCEPDCRATAEPPPPEPDPPVDDAPTEAPPNDSGCGCTLPGRGPTGGWPLVLLLAALAARRRPRRVVGGQGRRGSDVA